jgi:hypothetical protein
VWSRSAIFVIEVAASCRASPLPSTDAGSGAVEHASSAPAPVAVPESSTALPPSAPTPPPPTAETYPPVRKATLSLDELAKLVVASPELAHVGSDLAFFDPADGSYILRSTADREGITFSSQPILWSPEAGQQMLVVAARGKAASFVAAWWMLPDGGHRLASTFVMMGEIAPVALAYRPAERTLWWTSCWQCPGESGHVSVRDDHHVVIVQD